MHYLLAYLLTVEYSTMIVLNKRDHYKILDEEKHFSHLIWKSALKVENDVEKDDNYLNWKSLFEKKENYPKNGTVDYANFADFRISS